MLIRGKSPPRGWGAEAAAVAIVGGNGFGARAVLASWSMVSQSPRGNGLDGGQRRQSRNPGRVPGREPGTETEAATGTETRGEPAGGFLGVQGAFRGARLREHRKKANVVADFA